MSSQFHDTVDKDCKGRSTQIESMEVRRMVINPLPSDGVVYDPRV